MNLLIIGNPASWYFDGLVVDGIYNLDLKSKGKRYMGVVSKMSRIGLRLRICQILLPYMAMLLDAAFFSAHNHILYRAAQVNSDYKRKETSNSANFTISGSTFTKSNLYFYSFKSTN